MNPHVPVVCFLDWQVETLLQTLVSCLNHPVEMLENVKEKTVADLTSCVSGCGLSAWPSKKSACSGSVW